MACRFSRDGFALSLSRVDRRLSQDQSAWGESALTAEVNAPTVVPTLTGETFDLRWAAKLATRSGVIRWATG
jgi:hypothetical protein